MLAAVVKYLTSKGVDKKQLKVEAMGDKKPKKGKLAPKSTLLELSVIKKLEIEDLVPPYKDYWDRQPVADNAPAKDDADKAKDASKTPAENNSATQDNGGEMEMELDMGDLSL